MKYNILIFCVSLFVFSCGVRKADNNSMQNVVESKYVGNKSSGVMLPKAVIYKTTHNYNDYVPVIMDEGKKRIISYPAPSDLYYNGKLAKPLELKNGYLLDNRGINRNVVFTDYTYEEYSNFKEAPSLEELKAHIKDIFPLSEMYYTEDSRNIKNGIDYYNDIIDSGFKNCVKEKVTGIFFEP